MASALTTKEVDDGAQVGPMLEQITNPLASFMGDGAYDQDGVYAAVAERTSPGRGGDCAATSHSGAKHDG